MPEQNEFVQNLLKVYNILLLGMTGAGKTSEFVRNILNLNMT